MSIRPTWRSILRYYAKEVLTLKITRTRATVLVASLFIGGVVAAACQPADASVFTPPVGSVCELQEVRR
ncbi:hypothetical protein F8M49_29920 [Rhodococcus zopfii]|uniref:Uncharacterized protein n=1 Tax=Rhodococcus zopfii TaxID=43772 RepID=A0ABU3WL87_9NOCA|nr:hypothetical protein [Rhodococcus zopfii]MDV2478580.1 hypothetical protein [Rhodococcus zopfii]